MLALWEQHPFLMGVLFWATQDNLFRTLRHFRGRQQKMPP